MIDNGKEKGFQKILVEWIRTVIVRAVRRVRALSIQGAAYREMLGQLGESWE